MATTHYIQTDPLTWCVQTGQRNSHNSIIWPITVTDASRSAPRVQIGKDANVSLRVPFGVSQFSPDSKKSLDFSISPWQPDILEFLEKIDNMIVNYIFEHQANFFKKPYSSVSALMENYHGLVSKREGYDSLLKTKVGDKVSIFKIDEHGSSKGTLDDIKAGAQAVPIISPSSIWTMGSKCGVSCNTSALMLWPASEKAMGDLFQTDLAFGTPMVECQA